MKVEILQNISIKGVPANAGDILEIDDADYRMLLSYQLVKPYEEKSIEDDIEDSIEKKSKIKGGKKK